MAKKIYVPRTAMAQDMMERNGMMNRVRAAVALYNSTRGGSESMKMAAFLDIFHPNLAEDTRLSLMQDARERDRRA